VRRVCVERFDAACADPAVAINETGEPIAARPSSEKLLVDG
jgi:hypothetical protein